MQKISEHISYREAVRSDIAKRYNIDNCFNDDQLVRMKLLAEKVFESVRKHFNVPIFISSFFRSIELNKKLGGAKNSQHCANNGAAIDMDADVYSGLTNKQLFDYIKDNLDFDQLILENVSQDGIGGWIHCSYVSPDKNRKEILTMKLVNGKKYYKKYTEPIIEPAVEPGVVA